MVIIHSSWELLKKKLLQKDNLNIQKRVGANKTPVVVISRREYDENIPIFSKEKLEAFLRSQNSPEPEQQPVRKLQQKENHRQPQQQPTQQPIQQPTQQSHKQPPKVQKKPDPHPQLHSKQHQQLAKQALPVSSPIKRSFIKTIDKIPKKITKKRKKNESIWKGDIDELVIKEEIDDEFCRFTNDDSDSEDDVLMSKNLKKIRVDSVPPKPSTSKLPQKPNSPPKQDPNLSPQELPEEQVPPKVVKPLTPNWPETVKKFEENQLNIVYKDLYHFKSYIKSDERVRTLLKEMVIKCLQNDDTFLLLDMLALTPELNYNEDKDKQFWSETVGRLKRKLNINCGMVKYKSSLNPDQIRSAYKRAVIEISKYARDQNIVLHYLDSIFLFSSNIQPPPTDQNASTDTTQPNGVSEPRQPEKETEPPSKPQIQEASTVPESQVPKVQPKSEANAIPVHRIKTRLSPPLQPLNKFIVRIAPDIKPDIKKENVNRQENNDPTVERKLTLLKRYADSGRQLYQIKTSINRDKTQKFGYKL